jgi:hypothetical protein
MGSSIWSGKSTNDAKGGGVMDAKLVWATWRRILRNDRLIEWALRRRDCDTSVDAGLTGEELAILIEYASTPAATDTNIGMYRQGLVRNALAALSLVPLTRGLLFKSALDVDAVAANFVLSTDYRDDGPNFWKTAGDFVAHLTKLPEFAEPFQQDILGLDAAMVALARRLCESPPAVWPESAAKIFLKYSAAGPRPVCESTRFVASLAAVSASSRYDLTPCLENLDNFDADQEIQPSERHWLIYFPTADPMPAYAELSERTARVFNLLSTPKTASDVSSALGGLPSADVIDSLTELGVVVREDDTRIRE